MHGFEDFLQDLAVVMIVAATVTVLFHKLKQPVVLGYIMAGVIIGPYTPGGEFINDEESIRTLSELGVVFLMFSLGLEFSLRKLKGVGPTAFIAAILEILLMIFVGYEVGRLFGWSVMDSIFLGAILSVSSTTIIIRALAELKKTKEKFAELIFGILIVEDILAIVLLALLSGIAMTGKLSGGEFVFTITRLSLFLVLGLVVGLIAVPRFIGFVGKTKNDEMLLVTVLGLCFGVALLAVKLGYSFALGAFLIGAVIAESKEIHRIEHLMIPIRDMFSAVFFVSIGLLIQPGLLVEYAVPILVITLAVVIGKVVTCSFGTFVAGNDTRTSLRVGMGLAQIGEFSFIIATLGVTLGVTSKFLYPIAVTVSAITTLLTPYLIKSSDHLVNWFDRTAPVKLKATLEVYTTWVKKLGAERPSSMAATLLRKWLLQAGLNLALIAAIFVAADLVADRASKLFPGIEMEEDRWQAVHWLVAMVISLPLFIATFRKLQAVGILVAEQNVSRAAAGENTQKIRNLISQFIPITGAIAMGLMVLLLSSALLLPLQMLVPLCLVLVIIGILMWRSFIRLYSQAQFMLQETFAHPPTAHEKPKANLPPMLKDAEVEEITVVGNSIFCGRLLRELNLRQESGASIVAVEKGGETTVNPGPDVKIEEGDKLLILGSEKQIELARRMNVGANAPVV